MSISTINLIGAALGWGAQIVETEQGPEALKSAQLDKMLSKLAPNIKLHWPTTLYPSLIAKDSPDLSYDERVQ